MKKLLAIAALLMVTTTAHAGQSYSFQIEGHKIRVSAPKNCTSLSCLQISAPSISKGLKSKSSGDDTEVAANSDAPAQKPAAAAPVEPTVAAPQPPAATDTASDASTIISAVPALKEDIATSAPSTATAAAPTPAPNAAVPAAEATTPLGIWATENNKGKVRVEQCGQNLCGYGLEKGEKILINMKPSDKKWTGQIHDPDSGRTYASTIAMKGPNVMRVQGCAFGGMFCGGQTWKRIS